MKKFTLDKYVASRAAQVEYICGVGGYSRRGDHWPISFNVDAGGANLEFDHLWSKYHKDYLPSDVKSRKEKAEYRTFCENVYSRMESDLFWEACEDARCGLRDRDPDHGFWFFGKEIKADVEFLFSGQQGKHLVISTFEGHALNNTSPDDLRDVLLAQSDNWSTGRRSGPTLLRGCEWTFWSTQEVRLLYQFVRHLGALLTRPRVREAVECSAASLLFGCYAGFDWDYRTR